MTELLLYQQLLLNIGIRIDILDNSIIMNSTNQILVLRKMASLCLIFSCNSPFACYLITKLHPMQPGRPAISVSSVDNTSILNIDQS